jgi:hypothetical protein
VFWLKKNAFMPKAESRLNLPAEVSLIEPIPAFAYPIRKIDLGPHPNLGIAIVVIVVGVWHKNGVWHLRREIDFWRRCETDLPRFAPSECEQTAQAMECFRRSSVRFLPRTLDFAEH